LPAALERIGDWAFNDCRALTQVTFPSSVTEIGVEAFAYCSSLTAAYFEGAAPALGKNAFMDAAEGFTVYYQTGAAGFEPEIPLDAPLDEEPVDDGLWNGYPRATYMGAIY
jgi:hypothetical protein